MADWRRAGWPAWLLILALAVLGLAGCLDPPKVVQGKTVSYEASSKVLVLQDERQEGKTLEFSTDKADIGAVPAPGDLLRLAYRVEGNRNLATRIMNITKQKDLVGGKE